MNGIPTTFDEHQIKRTVIGGKRNTSENAMNLSVILLNTSGSHFKVHVFENLINCNFLEIVSVENDAANFSIEDSAKKFPSIKFIVPLEPATDGEMINLTMSELTADYVLVIRDSLYIPSGIILQNLAKRITSEGIYCVVPWLMDQNKESIATYFAPSAEKTHFVIDSSSVVTDGIRTLYPFDNIGIYNRKKFINLGGFDYTIQNSYWQSLDLAVRSWLWGEETKITTMLSFSYINDTPVSDRTVNKDYLRYYLKNELPRIKNDRGVISRRSFFKFFFHSSCGFLEARRLFKTARKWVDKNKYYFKKDLPNLMQNWTKKDED
ncbi:MAG: hypothetical protein MJ179_03170 [Treponema sp.]|nr:hypothetical protein [Treponema sp.]